MVDKNYKIMITEQVRQNLLMTSKEKESWLGYIPTMPLSMQKKFFAVLKKVNTTIHKYMVAAATNDPDGKNIQELKQLWKKVSNDIAKISQEKDKNKAEQQLDQNINSLS